MLLLHTPPPVTSLSVVVSPEHIVVLPVIAKGAGFTVTTACCVQPAPAVSVIVAVPTAPAVTTVVLPGPGVTDATEILLLAHVPLEPSDNILVAPAHIDVLPDIAVGNGLTVTVVVTKHPVAVSEYVICVDNGDEGTTT